MHMTILAQAAAEENANAFWGTSFGSTVKVLLAAAAILILIGAVMKSVGKFTQGKPADALKIIGGAVVAAVFLFRPELLTSLIDLVGSLFESLFESGDELIDEVE